jgi:hypothetical protein
MPVLWWVLEGFMLENSLCWVLRNKWELCKLTGQGGHLRWMEVLQGKMWGLKTQVSAEQ